MYGLSVPANVPKLTRSSTGSKLHHRYHSLPHSGAVDDMGLLWYVRLLQHLICAFDVFRLLEQPWK